MSINSELNRLFKHVSIYTFGNALSRGGAFILIPLYTRHLLPSEYGILELFYAITSVIASFLSLGLAHATLRFYFEYESLEEKKAVVSTSIISSFLITVAGISLISTCNPLIKQYVFKSNEIGHSLYIIYGIIVLEMTSQIGISYLRAKEYSKTFVLASFTRLVILVSSNIYTVIILKMGVEGILFGNFAAVLAESMVINGIVLKECGIRFQRDKFKELIGYSYPFLLSSVFAVLIANFDRFYLSSLYSFASVGIYALATKFGLAVTVIFIEPFQRGYGAFRFSIIKQQDAQIIQSRVLIYLASGISLACLVIAAFSEEVLSIMSARDYMDAASLIPIIMASTAIGSLGYVFQTGILYQKRTKQIFSITALTSTFNLVFTIGGIYIMGTYGAVLARLATCIFNVIYTYSVSQKVYYISYPVRKITFIMIIGALCYGLINTAAVFTRPLLVMNIGIKIIILGIFISSLFWFKALDKSDANYIFNLPRILGNRIGEYFKIA